ncbi:MAG: IS1 family transposase [candidate division Zixibacteria bacterium]|nr:IS1 family transposase [candidate division Zixibacteria bacterium]
MGSTPSGTIGSNELTAPCFVAGIKPLSFMTNYWEPYEHFVPAEKHIQSKAETFTVEGYNSLFRHFLARFRRKTKCYSKCETMLRYSVMLLMAKRNGELEYGHL